MIQALLTDKEHSFLDLHKHIEIEKKKRKMSKKRKTHFRNITLSKLYNDLEVGHSDILYEIPFKCHFSFYLYLILKSQNKFYDFSPAGFKLATSQTVNFNKIHKMTGTSRKALADAYKELVKFGLIIPTPEILPDHLAQKSCLVFNDFYIHSYDPDKGKVNYTTEIKHNFYKEDE